MVNGSPLPQKGAPVLQAHWVSPSAEQIPTSPQYSYWPFPAIPQIEATFAPTQIDWLQLPHLGPMMAFSRLLEAGVLKPGSSGVEEFAAHWAGAVDARGAEWLG